MRYAIIALPVIVVLAVLFVALQGTSGEKAMSGIEGRIVLAPICPVEQIPPDPACAPVPYETTVTVSKSGTERILATVATDKQGYFSINLVPGMYVLTPKGGSVLPSCNEVVVEVFPDLFAYTDISCDTGIR